MFDQTENTVQSKIDQHEANLNAQTDVEHDAMYSSELFLHNLNVSKLWD